ncbi:MAG: ArsC/Spx/MgsR family protein [Chitinophagales bacterium]|nr:ArsC/Spx/MgsR family protein [Chitinophagales bacterium]
MGKKPKVYFLGTCDTCRRIMKEVGVGGHMEQQEIKSQPLDAQQIDELAKKAGSYEAIFSKKSQLYRSQGWHEKTMTEADYRKLLLEHYTFLKRPVFEIGNEVFAGNAKAVVEAVKNQLPKQ